MADADYRQHLEVLIPPRPFVDDESALIAARAIVELVSRRTPEALGDGLADLHALSSLLEQLRDWLPATTVDALRQHHSWHQVHAQLAREHTDRILSNGVCLLPPLKRCDRGNACLTCDRYAEPARRRDDTATHGCVDDMSSTQKPPPGSTA